MISICNRLNFIHVPKTGGTSIIESLKDAGVEFKGIPHTPYQDIIKIFPESSVATSVAILRHPYETLVSLYHYRRDELEKENIHKIPEYVSFEHWMEEYINNPLVIDSIEIKGGIEFVEGVEFIYKYEEIDKAWQKILKILKLPKNTELKRLNTTKHAPAITYFNSKLKKIAVNVAWKAFEKMKWEI